MFHRLWGVVPISTLRWHSGIGDDCVPRPPYEAKTSKREVVVVAHGRWGFLLRPLTNREGGHEQAWNDLVGMAYGPGSGLGFPSEYQSTSIS